MKKTIILCIGVLFLAGQVFAGVIKKTNSKVTFKGFGTFTSIQTEKISSDKKRTDSENSFKGKGLLGGMAAKMVLRPGEIGEIINLEEMMIYQMDHKKKEYEVNQITKMTEEREEEKEISEEEPEEEIKSRDIKIIRSEFRVDETGNQKVINQFPCKEYVMTWITEWEDLSSGEKGTDRLSTIIWTTPYVDEVKSAHEEEMKFSQEYMKRLGIDMDEVQQEILGTNWLSVFRGLSQAERGPMEDVSRYGEEMKKVEGYPVVIDGKYFASREGQKEEEEKEEETKSVKGVFGKLAKKALTKKSKDVEEEPAFAYYIELIEFSPSTVSETEFGIPAEYKKKG